MAKIKDVETRKGYRLLVELDNGNVIFVNMADKIETVRFYDLRNEKLFEQVETDGYSLYWDFGRIMISLTEIFAMTRGNNTASNSNFNRPSSQQSAAV